MAEIIKIAELTIDSKKLVSEMKSTKNEIDKLSKSQKELKDSGQENSAQFIRNAADLKSVKATYRAQEKTLQEVTGATRGLTDELKKEVKSLGEAEANNKALRKARRDVNTTTDEGKKALQEINSKIDKNTAYMKENQDAQVQQKMNVGNYKDSILEATGAQEAYTKGTEAMTAIQKLSTIVIGSSTGALKLFRIALASTGIGLIVLALGSLISYLTTTQEGMDKVTSVLVPLKELFQTFLGIIQDLGKDLFEAFSNPKKLISDIGTAIKQNLINRFTALSKIIKSVMDFDWEGVADGVLQAGTGVENLSGKIKSMGDSVNKTFGDAYKRGQEIDRLTKELSKSEGQYIRDKEKLNKVFEEQKKLAEDTNLSMSERQEAVNKAIESQEEISRKTQKRLNQEAQLLKLKQMSNDTSDEDKRILDEKLAEIDKAIAEEAAKTTELQNKKNSIIKEGQKKAAEARQKILDDAISKQQQELDYFIASQGVKAKTLKEEVEIAKEVSKQKQEVLEAQLKAGEISQKEYETQKLEIANELAGKQAELAVQNAEREVQIYRDANKSRLEDGQILTEQLVNQEQVRLDKIAEKEREYQKKRLEEGIINEQQYNEAINEINEENRVIKAERQAELDEQEKEKKLESIAYDREQELIRAEDRFERQQIQLDREYQAQMAEAKRLGKDTTEVEAQYAEQSKEIEAAKVNAKLNMATSTLSAVLDVMGKESAAGKAVATAMSLINTYQGITTALASAPPPVNFIQAAAVGAMGFKAVADIHSTKSPKIPAKSNPKKFAKGGNIWGDSHSNGGVQLEAEGGESIINKRSTYKYGGLLSAINQSEGGNPIIGGNQKPSGLIDYDLLAGKIAEANMSLPSPTIGVDEISSVSKRAVRIKERASF